MKTYWSILLLLMISVRVASAQEFLYTSQHRPPGMDWQELNTPHFRIIFPAGYDSVAFLSARILEDQYPVTQKLTGGSLSRFPLVITDYNDRSNGFVTPLNFRSEIDLSHFKGKVINPASGLWLEAVLPHELLHANHANVYNEISIGGILRYISPDLSRMINFFPPVGVHEGLAVYHETEDGISDAAGRGHSGYFNTQFYANATQDDPWNMSQTLITSSYHYPFDRHYIAGYSFTDWLHDTYGDEVSKRAISKHYNLFFLGYGYALKQVTGKWPKDLYKEYEADTREMAMNATPETATSTDEQLIFPQKQRKGVRQRGPVFINENEVIFYNAPYSAPRGLYRWNITNDAIKKIKEEVPVRDYRFSVDYDQNELYYASFSSRGRYLDAALSDINKMNLDNFKTGRITEDARVSAPEYSENGLLALQAHNGVANIVEISASGAVKTLIEFDGMTPVQLEVNPANEEELAVIINRRGVQGIWFSSREDLPEVVRGNPDLAFKGASVFDLQWHPRGKKLLFTLNSKYAMNVYEYDIAEGKVYQVTESRFGAFEASYAPGGDQIVLVSQRQNQDQLLALLNRDDFLNKPVSEAVLLTGSDLEESLNRPFIGDELKSAQDDWEVKSYSSSLSWLAPRFIYPVSINRAKDVYEYGAFITSTDVLQSQNYRAQITYLEDRAWYDFNYTNKTFWPGFSVSLYSEPSYQVISDISSESMLSQERGVRFGVPMSWEFKDLSRSNSLSVEPFYKIEQQKFYDLNTEPVSDFISRQRSGLTAQLNWRVLSQLRDFQPTGGVQLLATAETTFRNTTGTLSVQGGEYEIGRLNQRAVYYGADTYVAPLRHLNQSLKLGFRVLEQSDRPIYSVNSIVPLGFEGNPFGGASRVARFSSRYVIPISYADNGGMLVPVYLRGIYLSLFTHTLADMQQNDWQNNTRSIFGAGLHFKFNLSNLNFEVGIGVAFEPARENIQPIIGDF